MSSAPGVPQKSSGLQLGLAVGALGVVFGDIGTSPLYTMRECLTHLPDAGRAGGVLGALSLMFWALMFVVSFKYILFVTRADNRGEGGIFALLALSHAKRLASAQGVGFSTFVILMGAALLYGEGVITPAITVLSASEGLAAFNPGLHHWVVPIACAILACIFAFQSRGTKAIGGVFGPVMLLWFGTMGALGLYHLVQAPEALQALNPVLGLRLLAADPVHAYTLLGAVVLTFTGVEALNADLGHFGRRVIVRAWTCVACPALLLSYFGQGAWALRHPGDTTNPFFALAPDGPVRLALVALSITAAVIASQALISGAFSLTRQAIQLGFFPRLKILHTNPDQPGQIYLPLVNWVLAIGSIWIVFAFGSSSRLAGAYGIAVTGTKAVTSYAFARVAHINWNWPVAWVVLLCGGFLVVDMTFFTANLYKVAGGGWLPLVLGAAMLAIMHTWKSGRDEIQRRVYSHALVELDFSIVVRDEDIVRVPGSAVFMVATSKGTPLAVLHHLRANRCLQKTVVLLTITTEEVPHVEEDARLTMENLGSGVWRAVGRYGYMESPDVTRLVKCIRDRGVPLKLESTVFYFNREMIITGGSARMFAWQKSLYGFLSRNARPVKDYYQILPTQIIEIGLPVQL